MFEGLFWSYGYGGSKYSYYAVTIDGLLIQYSVRWQNLSSFTDALEL